MVVGNGNVAVDVARMLVLDPDELAVTDTADHAIEAFNAAGVREVVLLGRRGPAQAAFTNPELRELGELTRADVDVDPVDLDLDADSLQWLETEGDPTAKRNVDLLRDYAGRTPDGHTHRVSLRFLRSPVEILGEGEDGRVTGVRVARNRIERGDDGRLRAVPTGEEEVIECGLVLRSIGYRGRPLDDIPFDERRGLIRNDGRPRLRRGRRAGRRRVRRRLDQARPERRHRHEQEGRDRHRRARSSRTPRPGGCPIPARPATRRRSARGCAAPPPASSSGTAGRRSTSTSAAWASPPAARA